MSDSGAATTLLDLAEGFLALPRHLCASPFYRALRPDERSVVVEALLAARYAPGGEFWFAGRRIPLAVGQFIDTEEEIARRAGVKRKVVRTTYRKLATAGLLRRSRAHPAGQCPFVTTIVGYERILFTTADAGPRTEPPPGREGAKNRPAEGPPAAHGGAPSEQRNKGTRKHGNTVRAPECAAEARTARTSSSMPQDEATTPPKQLVVLDLTVGKPPLPDPGPSPHELAVAYWFATWERAGRGKHAALTPAEGATMKRLVRELGLEEFKARVDRAFLDRWFLENGDLLVFQKQRNKYAPPGKLAPTARTAAAMPATAFTGKSGGFGA